MVWGVDLLNLLNISVIHSGFSVQLDSVTDSQKKQQCKCNHLLC